MPNGLDPNAYIDVYKRIKELLEEQQKSSYHMLQSIGLTTNNVTKWNNGVSASFMLHIDRIAKYLGVSTDFLIFGKEPGLIGNEFEAIQAFRKLSNEKQKHIISTMKYMV